MKRKFFFILTIIVFLSMPLGAFAQSEYYSQSKKTALGITPGISEIVLDIEKPSTKKITVNNLTNFTLPIKAFLEGFSTKEMKNIPENIVNRFDSTKWFEINKNDKDFILQPQESRDITVTIRQPNDASPGGYYASLIFQPLIPEEIYSEDSVYIFTRVASVFLLQVKGDLDETIKFVDLKLPFWSSENEIDYTLTLENIGNTHSRPLTKIVAKELIRNRDYPEEIVQPSLILPGFSQETKGKYSDLPSIGIMKISTFTTYGPNNLVVDAPDRYLIVFPIRYIIFLITLLIVLLLIRSKVRRRLSRALKVLVRGEEMQINAYQKVVEKKGLGGLVKSIFKRKK